MKTTTKLITATVLATLFISIIGMAQMDNYYEEGYIDDIPFNTHEIALEATLDRSLSGFAFEEEEYVDDIPFDTYAIASDVCCDHELKQNYPLEDEAYIDDIPFNTSEIAGPLTSEEKAVPMTLNYDEKRKGVVL